MSSRSAAARMSAIRWRSNGVEGVTTDSVSTLRHLGENAELHVTRGRLSRGVGYASASRGARQSLARVGAVLRLREHNRYYVHASGVVNRKGLATVFVGESGSGKSTLAFALAREGWSMLGDDGVVLEPRDDSVLVHGWRSHSLISASLSSAFPELRGRESEAMPQDGRKRIPLTVAHVGHARLGALVFIRQGAHGSLRQCGQAHALTALIRQSPWVLLGDASSTVHFEALGRIAGSVPSFEFVHGHAELLRIGDFFDPAA
ncbi:MAG: hprK [Gemmatimonadetes bacterium]|jgi:hypothetical protein|nr:hprK [Gemmatimonadota bacterium]